MKKFYYCLAAMALASLTACSNEDLNAPAASGDEVAVTFAVDVPGTIQSRSWDAGEYTTQLQYAVYPKGEKTVITEGTATFTNLKTNVEVSLIIGYEYDIVFWAQDPEAPYSFSAEDQKVTVNYSDADVANDETRDAFYANLTMKVTKDTSDQDVTLKRPFAKVAVATSKADYKAAQTANKTNGGVPSVSRIAVKAYDTFNLMTEKVEGEAQVREFAASAYLQGAYVSQYIINSEYYWQIGSVFVLSDPAGELLAPEFQYGYLDENSKLTRAADALTFTNIPVKKNQKTIIYGDFFTKKVGYNVAIDATYDNFYYVDAVEGTTAFDQQFITGGTFTLSQDTTMYALPPAGTNPVTVDLSGKTLEVTASGSTVYQKGANVTFKNGTIKFLGQAGSNSTITIQSGATVTLDDVEYEGSGCAFYVRGDAAELNVINSTITSTGNLGIATNAATADNYNVKINVVNSYVSAKYGSWLNVPGEFNILDGSVIEGTEIAFMARAGKVTINGSTIKSTATALNTLYDETWKSGNCVAFAALTIGNRDSNAYGADNEVVIENSNIVSGGADCRALYVWPDQRDNYGLKLTIGENVNYVGQVWANTANLSLTGSFPEGFIDLTPSTTTH